MYNARREIALGRAKGAARAKIPAIIAGKPIDRPLYAETGNNCRKMRLEERPDRRMRRNRHMDRGRTLRS
jgi:hypothetical protein